MISILKTFLIICLQGVVTDGKITTARGLGYALDLGLELVRLTQGEDKAKEIKASIQYDQC